MALQISRSLVVNRLTPPTSSVAAMAPAQAPATPSGTPIPVAAQAAGSASVGGMMARLQKLSAPVPAPASMQVPTEPAPVNPASLNVPTVSAGVRVASTASRFIRLGTAAPAAPANPSGSVLPAEPPPVTPSVFLTTPAGAAQPGGSAATLPAETAAQQEIVPFGANDWQYMPPGASDPFAVSAPALQAAGGELDLGKLALYGGAAIGGLYILSRLFGGSRA